MNIRTRTLSALAAFATLLLTGPIAQAVIVPGDLAIIGANTEGDGSIAFVALNPIAAGTTLTFTDNAWVGTGFYDSDPGPLYSPLEGMIEYIVGASGLEAGQVVVLNSSGVLSGDVGGAVTLNGTFDLNTDAFAEAHSDFSTYISFDQVLVHTGTSDFVFGLNLGSTESWTFGEITRYATSDLPVGLSEGVTAINIPNNTWMTGDPENPGSPFDLTEAGNLVYTGIISGTPAQLLAAMADPINWTYSADPNDLTALPNLDVVPEPSTIAALFGLIAFGFAAWRRRK